MGSHVGWRGKRNVNDPSTPRVDIVLFGLFLTGFPRDFKTRLLGEGFHTLINDVFVLSLGRYKWYQS